MSDYTIPLTPEMRTRVVFADVLTISIPEIDELQARVKELETQRDELLNQLCILSDDFNSGEYNQYECAFAISDLIAKIEARRIT